MAGEGVNIPVEGGETWARFAEFLEKSNRNLDRLEESARRIAQTFPPTADALADMERRLSMGADISAPATQQ